MRPSLPADAAYYCITSVRIGWLPATISAFVQPGVRWLLLTGPAVQ
jgi:hypothetical protein